MSWLTNLFGKGTTTVAEGAVNAASGVNKLVERWKPSNAATFEQDTATEAQTQANIDAARKYDPRSQGGGVIGETVNVFIDAASRAIRPGVTILLLGACFGWWPLPAPTAIPEVYFMWTQSVIAFWFGTRTIFKDIPSFILAMRASKK
jgi:hypothetical protein